MRKTLSSLALAASPVAAGLALMLAAGPAGAMSPQQCYRHDSQCTQFCARIKNQTWRYECFSRCNIYLNNCIARGIWTDRSPARR